MNNAANNDITHCMEVLEDHFIRLRFGVSHIKTNYVKKSNKWELKDSFGQAFNGKISCLNFKHIDLALKHDCALSICRLLDKRDDVTTVKTFLTFGTGNTALMDQYNSIRGLQEFYRIKKLRDKKLGHISDNDTHTTATESDLVIVSERLEVLYKQAYFDRFKTPYENNPSVEEIKQSVTAFWSEIIAT